MMHVEDHFPPIVEQVLDRLKGVHKSLRGWIACCPSHDDQTPSLSIGLGKDGRLLLHCFAGCTMDAILEAMGLQVCDLFPVDPTASPHHMEKTQHILSLLDIAQGKKIPWRFLCNLGIIEESRGLRIPYYHLDGTPAPRYRIRTALVAKEGSWWNKSPGDILPYGLERLEEARQAGFLILVEGESDCWTLWLHHFPALGFPGAEMASKLTGASLTGIERLYLVQEPDAAGAKLVEDVLRLLRQWDWSGTAFVVSLPDAKDPNELHQRDWKGFKVAFQQALDLAQRRYQGEPVSAETASSPKFPAVMTLEGLLTECTTGTHWIIPGLLPEGIHLLGGKPKQGKSWFALAIALSVSAGSTILDIYQATRGDVLFLGLEETEQRLQARIRQLLSALPVVPSGLAFALQWPRLDEGGLEQLDAYIQAHPQVRCIIIDTWANIAPHTKGRSPYEAEYAALSTLKQLAERQHLAILVIHHLRKTQAHDVLDEMMGSTAMVGAVDAILILKRARGEGQATLFLTGRDIAQEQELPLLFDNTTGWWHLNPTVETDEHPNEEQSKPSQPAAQKRRETQ